MRIPLLSSEIFWLLLVMSPMVRESISDENVENDHIIKVPIFGLYTPDAGRYQEPVINYYTNLGLGSPRQMFKIQFDTTFRGELWVPKRTWSFPWASYLHYSTGFDCSKSQTCQQWESGVTMFYRHATFKADLIRDVLMLPGIRDPLRFNFSVIGNSDTSMNALIIDGFIGLSPKNQFPNTQSSSLMSVLLELGLIRESKFAIYFDNRPDYFSGQLILGADHDATSSSFLYDQFVIVHELDTRGPSKGSLWQFKLNAVALGHAFIGCDPQSSNPCWATIDSGSSPIRGPREQVQQMYDILGAKYDDDKKNNKDNKQNLAFVDCATSNQSKLVVTFTIDNVQYQMEPHQYIKPLGSRCFVSIYPNTEDEQQNNWILGTDFMSSYLISFDLQKQTMSISQQKKNKLDQFEYGPKRFNANYTTSSSPHSEVGA